LVFPVAASIATMASVKRLSPGRAVPSKSGDGLPTVTKMVLDALSYAGVVHTPPPPRCHASAYLALSAFSFAMSRWRSAFSALVAQVPHHPLVATGSSPGAGIEYQRHTCLPVAMLYAVRWPRMPYAPPDTPAI